MVGTRGMHVHVHVWIRVRFKSGQVWPSVCVCGLEDVGVVVFGKGVRVVGYRKRPQITDTDW